MTTHHVTDEDKAIEAMLESVTPETHPARDAIHYRRIIAARENVAVAQQELRDAVQAARDAGDTWVMIAAALDTSKQNASQRFGPKDARGSRRRSKSPK